MIKLKRIIFMLLLLVALPLISCSSGHHPGSDENDNIDGIPFYMFKKFVMDSSLYEIYKPSDVLFIDNFNSDSGKVIKYYYSEYNKIDSSETNLQNWTINYKQEVEKVFYDNYEKKELIERFYEEIKDSILEYSILFNTTLDYYNNTSEFEKEFIVDMNKEFESVFVIDLYLPYKLRNVITNEEYIFNVPIKSFLAYKHNDVICVIFDQENILLDYNTFISSVNVYRTFGG